MWETSIEEINFEKQSRGISSNCDNQIRHTTMYKIFILERDIPYTIYKNSNQVSLLLNNQKRKERKKNHAIIFRSNQNWQPNETSSFFFIDRTHQLLISTASQQYRSIHPLFPSSPFKNRYRLRIITETTNHTQLLLSLPPSPFPLLSTPLRHEKEARNKRAQAGNSFQLSAYRTTVERCPRSVQRCPALAPRPEARTNERASCEHKRQAALIAFHLSG